MFLKVKGHTIFIESEIKEQKSEIERRLALYRPQTREYDISGRTVILLDDGAATGALRAVARWVKKHGPTNLIIAVPVAPKDVVRLLTNEADQVEIIKKPAEF